MAYSTETELKNNIKILEKSKTALQITALFTEREAMAKKIIKSDLSNCVDFTKVNEIDGSPATPDAINLLSQYKTAELTYVELGSIKRRFDEQDDRKFWEIMYKELLNKIKTGQIKLTDEDGDSVGNGVTEFSNTSKDDVKPEFGYGKYGQYENDADLKEIRDNEFSRRPRDRDS